MDKELLTPEELTALKEATADYGAATNYWLLKIQLCFICALSLMVFTGFYPDLVVSWLSLADAPNLDVIYALLETRAVTALVLTVTAYFGYRYLPNVKVTLGIILSVVTMNVFLDIPVYYTAKMAIGEWDLSALVVIRLVVLYFLASLYLTADYLPAAPRKLFVNPFRQGGYSDRGE
jgi:hypothetical protein